MSTAETARAASAARRLALTAPAAAAPRSATTRTQRRRATRRALVAVAALMTVLATVAVAPPVGAQSADGGSDEVRIVARKLADGRIEFALRQHQGGDSWGDPLLPRARFFPADATVGRWLRSSPLTIIVAATTDRAATEAVVRIVARKVADGRVEFALRKQLSSSTYSAPLLPQARFFPTTATVGRRLQSTPISVITTQPTATTTPTTQPASEPCSPLPEHAGDRLCLPPVEGTAIRLFSDWRDRAASPDFEAYLDSGLDYVESAHGVRVMKPLVLAVGTVIQDYNTDPDYRGYAEWRVTEISTEPIPRNEAWTDVVYGISACVVTYEYEDAVWVLRGRQEREYEAMPTEDGRWRLTMFVSRVLGSC